MLINFKELKDNAKKRMITKGAKIFVASTILFTLLYGLNFLVTRISGYDVYMTQYSKAMLEYYETGSEALFDSLTLPEITLPAGILLAAIGIMQWFINLGFSGYCLTQSRSLPATFMDIFNIFEHAFTAIGMIIRTLLVVLINSLPGIALFIAPYFVGDSWPAMILSYLGLGLVAYWYIRKSIQFSVGIYVMFDNPDFSAKQCLNTANDLLKERYMEYLRLRISFVWWYVLNNVMSQLYMPFLAVWLNPYVGLTTANYYNKLCDKYVEIILVPEDHDPEE